MNFIEKLPDVVANQIAVGEVVLRPANVVKELLENAIDADARNIRAETDGGGVARICIIDDGQGMSRADATLCIERHATSKLREATDLESIETLGFRGEALPSIASVSELVIRTRTRQDDEGTEVVIRAGVTERVIPCGCSPGTSVMVQNLFYNVPARRKFLRALSTESAHITETIRSAALAHPDVTFRQIRDGRETHRYLCTTGRDKRAADVLACKTLTAMSGSRGPVDVEAHLALAEEARARASGLLIFVNLRPVQDRSLVRAVATAYGDRLAQGRFPVGVVFVSLPPELVDVNVHPQKSEVRFAHARAVTDAVYSVVSQAMGARHPHVTGEIASHTATTPAWQRPRAIHDGSDAEEARWRWSQAGQPRMAEHDQTRVDQRPATNEPRAYHDAQRTTRLATVTHDRFMVIEQGDDLLILDGHVLAQLAVQRATAAEWARGQLVAQLLLFPIEVTIDRAALEAFAPQLDTVKRFGFDISRSADTQLRVRAVPRCLAHAPTEALTSNLVSLLTSGTPDPQQVLQHLSTTCKSPNRLSHDEATELLVVWLDSSPEDKTAAESLRIEQKQLTRQ